MSGKRFEFPKPKRSFTFALGTDLKLETWVKSLCTLLSDESVYASASDERFDFTYESLRFVDERLAVEFPDGTDLSDTALQPKLNWFAAYVGETFLRNFREGGWSRDRRKNPVSSGQVFIEGRNKTGAVGLDPWIMVERAVRGRRSLASYIPTEWPSPAPKPNVYQLLVLPLDGHRLDRKHVADTVESAARLAKGAQLVTPEVDCLRIELGDSYLRVDLQQDDSLIAESKEIADMTGASCGVAAERVTTCGYDPNLELLDSFTLITENLQNAGRYALFDPVDGKLLFDV